MQVQVRYRIDAHRYDRASPRSGSRARSQGRRRPFPGEGGPADWGHYPMQDEPEACVTAVADAALEATGR
jgi:hypothetical protein